MASKMSLLAVSLAYPPLAYPRSIQVARLLKYCGIPTVMFCGDEPGARQDETIEPDAAGFLEECVRVRVRDSLVTQTVDRVAHRFARGLWNRRNLVPDRYGAWKSDTLEAVAVYSRGHDYVPDVIVTFAQPFSGHLIGLELKKRLKRPWIAHFSDPWVDNPFSPFDEETRALNEQLERSVAEAADRLIFTSEETVDLFFRKYPDRLKEKARVLPQCYDADRFGNDFPHSAAVVTMRYLGNFYGNRKPTPLIQALRKIAREDPTVLAGVAIELIGAGDLEEVAELSRGLPADVITARNSVNYDESLRRMRSSDGLLIIDAPAELSVFLPSKLIDYIGAGRPIFGITPSGSAATLIRELGGEIANPSDIDEVAGNLVKFILYLKKRRTDRTSNSLWGPDAIRERYRAETVAETFRQIVKAVTDEW